MGVRQSPSSFVVAALTSTAATTIGTANSAGSNTKIARCDHVHKDRARSAVRATLSGDWTWADATKIPIDTEAFAYGDLDVDTANNRITGFKSGRLYFLKAQLETSGTSGQQRARVKFRDITNGADIGQPVDNIGPGNTGVNAGGNHMSAVFVAPSDCSVEIHSVNSVGTSIVLIASFFNFEAFEIGLSA
jgi:hypothetical protein